MQVSFWLIFLEHFIIFSEITKGIKNEISQKIEWNLPNDQEWFTKRSWTKFPRELSKMELKDQEWFTKGLWAKFTKGSSKNET